MNPTKVMGERYIANGASNKDYELEGTPGNALGAYLDGANINLIGNAQDATGDTMNAGRIVIHGSTGDAAGYAMRGGKIYVKRDAGYRAGIHMKAYKEKVPVLIIGGKAGYFLGEYQAGGIIIVLGIDINEEEVVGKFCGTGMHGGKIYIRTEKLPEDLPVQVISRKANKEDMDEIDLFLTEYCGLFSYDKKEIVKKTFYVLVANSKNPYKQLYVHN